MLSRAVICLLALGIIIYFFGSLNKVIKCCKISNSLSMNESYIYSKWGAYT